MRGFYPAFILAAVISIFSLDAAAQGGNGVANGMPNGRANGTPNGMPNGSPNGTPNGMSNGTPNRAIGFRSRQPVSISVDPAVDTPERVRRQRGFGSNNSSADRDIHNYLSTAATQPPRRITVSDEDRYGYKSNTVLRNNICLVPGARRCVQ